MSLSKTTREIVFETDTDGWDIGFKSDEQENKRWLPLEETKTRVIIQLQRRTRWSDDEIDDFIDEVLR